MRIIVVSSCREYRRLAGAEPKRTETVLEIGCSSGLATEALARSCRRVVAVDLSAELVERTRRRTAACGNVEVVQLDGRDIPEIAALVSRPDLIFMDIGGDALLDNVTSQLRLHLRAFKPRLVVVRSFELAALCSLVERVEVCQPASSRRAARRARAAQALEALLALSRSSSVNSRAFAVRRLRKVRAPRARERLAQMAADPNAWIRRIVRPLDPKQPASKP